MKKGFEGHLLFFMFYLGIVFSTYTIVTVEDWMGKGIESIAMGFLFLISVFLTKTSLDILTEPEKEAKK